MTTSPQPVYLTPAAHHRFLLLDALRGLAALFVVAWHFPPALKSSLPNSNGLLAVDFFFCLSGFVIAFSYERRLAQTLTYKTFTIARLIRLYPMYILGTFFGFLVAAGHQHIFAHGLPDRGWVSFMTLGLFMLPTFLRGGGELNINFPFDGPAWSLFYEVIANLVYAALIKLRAAQTTVVATFCVVALAILAVRIIHGGSIDVGFETTTFYLGFARVTFSFFAGVLLFRLHQARKSVTLAPPSALAPALVTFALIAILISPIRLMQSEPFRLLAIAIVFPTLVYFGARARLPHRLAVSCAALGDVSYPLYLLHRPLLAPLYSPSITRLAAAHPKFPALILPIVILLLAIISLWIARRIDTPIRRFLTQRYNKPATAQTTLATAA